MYNYRIVVETGPTGIKAYVVQYRLLWIFWCYVEDDQKQYIAWSTKEKAELSIEAHIKKRNKKNNKPKKEYLYYKK